MWDHPSRFATALRALQSRTPVLRARPYSLAGRLAFAIFVAVLLNPDYRLAVYVMVAIYVLATIFFALYGRKHLVLSPDGRSR